MISVIHRINRFALIFMSIIVLISLYLAVFSGGYGLKSTNKRVENPAHLYFGGMDDNPCMFREPRQVSLTPSGTILVSDFRNYRIQELTPDGTCLGVWGRRGNKAGQFEDPAAAAMDSGRNIYVADTWNHRIQRFCNESDSWNANWAKSQFSAPRGIAVDSTGRVYVTNTSNHTIMIFNPDGELSATWGTGQPESDHFFNPVGIEIGPDRNVYVADTGNNRIKILDRNGQTLRLIPVDDWKGSGFTEAYIAVDINGMIYVTSPTNHKVIVYTNDGLMYSRFGNYGAGANEFNRPTGIALTQNNRLIVSDTVNNRIIQFPIPPPLPETQRQTGFIPDLPIAVRLIIDVVAIGIVFFWIRLYFKYRQKKAKTKFVQFHDRHPALCQWLIVAGILCVATGMIFLRISSPMIGSGTILMTIGALLLWAGFRDTASCFSSSFMASKRTKTISHVLAIIVFFAAIGLRFHRLQSVPTGINNDAAWNAIYAYRILDGEPFTPFTEEAWGKETFYFYLIALSFKLFGTSVYSLYLPGIAAGVLTVAFLFVLCRDLWNREVAIATSAVYAVMAWNLTYSRTGYRAVLAPLFMVMTGWFFYRAVDSYRNWKRLLFYAASGLSIGMGLHTYFSFRGIPFMMILIGIHTWITTPNFMRRNWPGLLVMQLFAWLMFFPLLLYALNNPQMFLERTGYLFVGNLIRFSGSWQPLWDSIRGHIQIFHYRADVGNFFEPSMPIISAIAGFFMMIGLAYSPGYIWKRNTFWVIMTAVFGLLPGLLSEPDATRLILFTVPLAIMIALGLVVSVKLLIRPKLPLLNRIPANVWLAAGLLWIGISEYRLYFHIQAKSPHAQFGYAPVHTQVGYKALELSADYHVYVSNSHFLDTPKFLCYRIPGDVFAITGGREPDFITNEEIRDNLQAIRDMTHSPDKGIAFVLDHYNRNMFVMQQIKMLFPGVTTHTIYRETDSEWPEPVMYVMTIESAV
jgi:DNA-binding beta-propeller fold protein YncE/4-amino-4-deoxy-L-arabinose transferase-like glycosyltransferase